MNNIHDTKITKVIASLASVAFLLIIFYVIAFFRVPETHAAEPLVYANVMIEDDSMRPLALNIPAPSVSVDASVDVNANTNGDTSTTANTDANASLNIPANITTSNDLTLYTKTLQEEDRDLSGVVASDDRIVVSYRKPAKFLGFIPTSVTANAKVNSDGKVTLSYPWYTFLSTKNDAALRANLQTKVDGVVGNSTVANLDIHSRARVIETLRLALKQG